MAANHRSLANDELQLVEEVTSNIVSRQPAVVTRQPGDFRAGFVATLPLWLGAAPFGAIYAVSALAAGLDWAQTLAMSLCVFAGASQFTAVGLFAAGASPFTIVLTTLIINARHALLAASVAPFVRDARPSTKALLAFQLTDESYAIAMRRWLDGSGSLAYQFGANISMYVIWQCSTIAGILLGNLIPDPAAYGLDLIFPLTFIGLLVPLLRNPEDLERYRAVFPLLLRPERAVSDFYYREIVARQHQ